jgi:hypothetical protein
MKLQEPKIKYGRKISQIEYVVKSEKGSVKNVQLIFPDHNYSPITPIIKDSLEEDLVSYFHHEWNQRKLNTNYPVRSIILVLDEKVPLVKLTGDWKPKAKIGFIEVKLQLQCPNDSAGPFHFIGEARNEDTYKQLLREGTVLNFEHFRDAQQNNRSCSWSPNKGWDTSYWVANENAQKFFDRANTGKFIARNYEIMTSCFERKFTFEKADYNSVCKYIDSATTI